MLYRLESIKKRFGQRTVLDLARLELPPGGVSALLGPNGAGKTTLLEILAFLSPPSAGGLWFQGRKVDFKGNRLGRLRRQVVLVQQHPIMFTVSVQGNLSFPLKIRRTAPAAMAKTIDELLELVDLAAFKKAPAHRLSGGETQRLAIARALACSPQVILFDEPTANVDVENQIAIERLIGEISARQGVSVIFTTHNMDQAARLAQDIVFLYEGKLAQSTYENIFSGNIEKDRQGGPYCALGESFRLYCPGAAPGPVRLSLDPNRIEMAPPGGPKPPQGAMEGRLLQLTAQKERVRALVDIGLPLYVHLPAEKFADLDLSVGARVWLSFPSGAVQIL